VQPILRFLTPFDPNGSHVTCSHPAMDAHIPRSAHKIHLLEIMFYQNGRAGDRLSRHGDPTALGIALAPAPWNISGKQIFSHLMGRDSGAGQCDSWALR
jgi:hypothetical protein